MAREDLNVHLCGWSKPPQEASLRLQHLLDPWEGAEEPLQGQEEVQGLQRERANQIDTFEELDKSNKATQIGNEVG